MRSTWSHRHPLCHPACPRPAVGPERSGGICSFSSAHPMWRFLIKVTVLPFVIPRGCDFFGLLHRQRRLGAPFKPGFGLSGIHSLRRAFLVIPNRTRISCHASPDTAACAAFVTESSMKLANATKLNRKSGGADLRCSSPSSNSAAFKPSPFAVAFRKGAQQVPRLPPDFLSGLVASVNLMRLSLLKAAYVVVLESSVVGSPEFARDDKKGRAAFT